MAFLALGMGARRGAMAKAAAGGVAGAILARSPTNSLRSRFPARPKRIPIPGEPTIRLLAHMIYSCRSAFGAAWFVTREQASLPGDSFGEPPEPRQAESLSLILATLPLGRSFPLPVRHRSRAYGPVSSLARSDCDWPGVLNLRRILIRMRAGPSRGPTSRTLSPGTTSTTMDIAKLALEDGTVFTGRAFGARGEVDGEVVFNTSMTGYQEILTDPSYHGQIVAMTYPLIGNYGVNAEDAESRRPWVRGFVVRELSRLASNYRSQRLARRLPGRARHHRHRGDRHPRPRPPDPRARGDEGHPLDDRPRRRHASSPRPQASPGLVGRDLAREVMPDEAVDLGAGLRRARSPRSRRRTRSAGRARRPHVVALDFGMKWNIPRHLVEIGCRVTVVPGSTPAEAILEHEPDGIFLSNGPGDPGRSATATATLETLIRTAAESRASRSSASAWATSSSARPSAPRPSSSSSATAGPTTRSATSRPARSRSPPRTTASPSTRPRCPPTSRPTHINLNDQTLEGLRHTPPAGLQRPVPPRGLRRPARQPVPVRRVPTLMG